MPLPIFLQPLLLVVYYQQRLSERILRMFGPVEQAVAFVVIAGLGEYLQRGPANFRSAMQTPPSFWAPTPGVLVAPQVEAVPLHQAEAKVLSSVNVKKGQTNGEIDSASSAENETTQDPGLTPAHSSGYINATAILIILLTLNLLQAFVPADLKKRLKESWDIFWPPWQDRSRPRSSFITKDAPHLLQSPDPSEMTVISEKVEMERKSAQKGEDPSSSMHMVEKKDIQIVEAASIRTTGDRGPEKELEKVREKVRIATSEDRKEVEDKTEEVIRSRSEDRRGSEISDKRAVEGKRPDDVSSGRHAEDEVTESERARKVKKGISASRKPSTEEPPQSIKDKGKERMEGERPKDVCSAAKTDTVQKVEVKEVKEKSRPRPTSFHTEISTPKSVRKDSAPSAAEKMPKTSPSSSDIEINPSDPLMSGDYRPLKSALKKSKKKPRQHKNIHHNFFMTMRGWRPALVPFPHGYHPKPNHARNSLWWDNIPKNAEHIMTPPLTPKKPADDGDNEEGKSESGKEKEKVKEKSRKEEKPKEGDKEKANRSMPKATVGDKDQIKSKEQTTDKEKDKERLRAEADAKARAKKEAEAKTAKTGSTSAASSSSSRPSASAAASAIAEPPTIPLNPQIQKATYVSQAFLCILLYYVHQQLGFLLLVFFVWQFIDAQNSAQARMAAARSTILSYSAAAPSRSVDGSERTRSSSKAKDEDGVEMDPAMKTKLEAARRAKNSSEERIIRETERDATRPGSSAQVTSEVKSTAAEQPGAASAGRTSGTPLESKVGSVSEDSVREDLMRQLKEMDLIVRNGRNVEKPTEEEKQGLKSAEEKRNALRKAWSKLTMPSAEMLNGLRPDEAVKPESREVEIKSVSNSVASVPPDSEKMIEFRQQIKEMEAYILRYRKIDDPTDEQKVKLRRGEEKRHLMKKELVEMAERAKVGSSGLSPEEKEKLA
ncbi:hypothetical protein IAR55_002159 [Kwoniella newhampshirensis]|uniref:Uncharacterized protein n=1 Tax=Kwoniella newhampshirensis TaxID=1651941 RepID=A0AAW0Z092_9TREE